MSDDANLITDARLIALETLLQRLYAMVLAPMATQDSVRIKQQLIEKAADWEIYPGSPPQDVETTNQKMDLVAFQVRYFINIVDEREKDIRKQMDLPRADLPNKNWT